MGFYSSKLVKAGRKPWRRDECGQMIEIGQPRLDAAYTLEGEFATSTAHPDCDAYAQAAFRGWDDGRPFLIDCDCLDEVLREHAPPSPVVQRLIQSAPWLAKHFPLRIA